jgi:NAD-dependent dihydropyrimidine dehydrogenase PreA subunit
MITIDEARCTGCGVCLSLCPQEAIVLEADRAEIKQELCSGCGICISACPQGAIQEADLVLATRLPARPEGAPAVALSAGGPERLPARARRVEVIRPSPSALERRRAVAAVAGAVGPVALDLLARLADSWFRRGRLLERAAGRQDLAMPGPGRGRRRRWRGGRCS